ncbi:circularly permuted type 2 ATP-grasp protein [Trichloromonas sp.]|uniref:circularly permuted type 2 ATP-grasp protein n=1 Tax=Trichloromonas sp. TaxID=3069249 RepID=UPI003D812D0E
MRFQDYDTGGFFDEMFDEKGQPRPGTEAVVDRFNALPLEELKRRQQAAEKTLLKMGITFSVYGDEQGTERIFPFDIVPRIIPHNEWIEIESGLKQRIRALNMFIDDLYHDQKILKDGIIPEDLVLSASGFRKECMGLNPPGGIWCHITGTDLVRGGDGKFYVLEDNLRCPSGVSYVLENRVVMKRSFPKAFDAARVIPVSDYPNRLLELLQYLAPPRRDKPVVAVWTPGIYNSAYFEHSFLAQQMGIELVEGSDLVVVDDRVMMRTTNGLKQVDVLYRRIDDDFIDPEVFRSDSMLGVPGLMRAYRAGRIALANAPGTGVADDKAVYAYVPDMIKYYLGEEAILNNVETYLCWRENDLKYVLANLDKLVVKKVGESGGYGMLVGPHATPQERAEYGEQVKANPRNFIAQPTLALSRVPTLVDDHFEGRHVDLRPYILFGEDIYVMPGGLTRVALKKGSLVVNSSQGGGSKDTWVVEASSLPQGGASC